MKKVGIVIILLGLGITIFTIISYFANRKVIGREKVEITINKPFHFTFSPISGIAIMGIGGIVFWQTYNPE
ncbi:MAG: hypothetical protein Q7U54_05065 [Bacteroidales bacterium]|nr:hypothetical protein [Bacteroidales bacterium]